MPLLHFRFKVGCENVHFQCNATDVSYILGKYHDRDVNGVMQDLTNAKCCMLKKCQSFVTKEAQEKLNAENLNCLN